MALTNTPTVAVARALADAAVDAGLAAAVQVIGPVSSTYRWGGSVQHAEEWLCLFKSSRRMWRELETLIRDRHPYQTPAIWALPVAAGETEYVKWWLSNLGPMFRVESHC